LASSCVPTCVFKNSFTPEYPKKPRNAITIIKIVP
jgi:hypothetical protein